jgi:tRNA 2-selenouridine synthase
MRNWFVRIRKNISLILRAVDVMNIYQGDTPLFDVRAPLEYAKGHIPGAINLPLFSNEERAIVGTCYKQVGQEAAIDLGVKLVGPKLHDLLTIVKGHAESRSKIRLYCWRGGMRSGFLGWFLNFVGFQAAVLPGGYKAFRKFGREQFEKQFQWHVVSGFTGSGKAEWLKLQSQALDLEKMASHRGSSFGLAPGVLQPSQEHFENLIAWHLSTLDINQPVFIEDESRAIGSLTVPQPIFQAMQRAPHTFLDVPLEERLERIIRDYQNLPRPYLIECTRRLTKRLGRERTEKVVQFIEQENLREAFLILLHYYDKGYEKSSNKMQRA